MLFDLAGVAIGSSNSGAYHAQGGLGGFHDDFPTSCCPQKSWCLLTPPALPSPRAWGLANVFVLMVIYLTFRMEFQLNSKNNKGEDLFLRKRDKKFFPVLWVIVCDSQSAGNLS